MEEAAGDQEGAFGMEDVVINHEAASLAAEYLTC
jgi:hypothetical protein